MFNTINRPGDVFFSHEKQGDGQLGADDLRLELSQAAGGITDDEQLLVSDGSCCAQ